MCNVELLCNTTFVHQMAGLSHTRLKGEPIPTPKRMGPHLPFPPRVELLEVLHVDGGATPSGCLLSCQRLRQRKHI